MTSFFVVLGVVIAVFFRVNPLLLIRNGHITPVEVRGRRGATKDSVLFGTARR